jgi:hybrid cluster-associated redox disulfide protein
MIDRKTPIEEVLVRHPQTARVFEEFGLGCAGCEAALFENVEQGAQVHGVDVDRLVQGLLKAVREG